MLYYPFCFLPLFLSEVRDDPDTFTRTMLAFGIQFSVSFLIFVLWPLRMAHPLLPLGLNADILRHIYACDSGFNSFPSLHLANIVFVSLLFLKLRGWRQSAWVVLVATLIGASTLLVKQHFILDIVAGILLGGSSYLVAFQWASPLPQRLVTSVYEPVSVEERNTR